MIFAILAHSDFDFELEYGVFKMFNPIEMVAQRRFSMRLNPVSISALNAPTSAVTCFSTP